jgi:hypothetical protein
MIEPPTGAHSFMVQTFIAFLATEYRKYFDDDLICAAKMRKRNPKSLGVIWGNWEANSAFHGLDG